MPPVHEYRNGNHGFSHQREVFALHPACRFRARIYMLMSYTINNSAAILWNLYFGLSFVVMMIIPGHILNNKSEKL